MENKKIKNFLTTFNNKTWEMNENTVYSGNWSLPFEKEKFVSKDNIMKYHWSDKSKLTKDYFYLQEVHEKNLKALSKILNDYHGVNFGLKSWSLLLSPWLMSIISIIFDKYESIVLALNKNETYSTKVLNYTSGDFSSFNYLDYILNKTTNDNWHHTIFSDIIIKVFNEKIKITKIGEVVSKSNNYYNFQLSFKDRIKKMLSLRIFLKTNNFFLDTNYVGFFDYLKILYTTNQKPFWTSIFNETKSLQKNSVDIHLRHEISKRFSIEYKNQFEKYLNDNILYFLPMSYLENFKEYQKKILDFEFNGKKIISRGAHFSNDLYKHWCCNQIEKGKKHYVSFHGGGIPLKYINFEYEYKIAEKVIVHNEPFKVNQIKLPVLNNVPKISYNRSAKRILIISKPGPSKFITRICLEPSGPDDLGEFLNLMKFVDKIKKDYKKDIYARFFQEDWELKKRFENILGKKKLDTYPDYYNSLKKTKIIVSSYLLTPFAESLTANIPSVCILKKENWTFDNKFNSLMEDMENKKILFFNPIDCAEHINRNYNKIYEWWNSSEIRSTIKSFREKAYYNYENKKIKEWTNFIKSESY